MVHTLIQLNTDLHLRVMSCHPNLHTALIKNCILGLNFLQFRLYVAPLYPPSKNYLLIQCGHCQSTVKCIPIQSVDAHPFCVTTVCFPRVPIHYLQKLLELCLKTTNYEHDPTFVAAQGVSLTLNMFLGHNAKCILNFTEVSVQANIPF